MRSDLTIRLSTAADRDAILGFIAGMGFNPRNGATWDGLGMLAMTAWRGDRLVGAVPMEPRQLLVSSDAPVAALHETVVAVDPEHRASGIGSQMQQAIADLRPANARLITVFREEPDSPAYRWYLKNAFLPLMHIQSWFFDRPAELAAPGNPRLWDIADAGAEILDRPEILAAWNRTSAGGKIDRTSRPLQHWLRIHPYHERYAFHVVADDIGGFAILGVGTLHSQTLRADVLELMPADDDPAAAESLIRSIGAAVSLQQWRPLRWSLSSADQRTAIAQSLGFVARWSFDLLARTLEGAAPTTENLAGWRFAGIDYA